MAGMAGRSGHCNWAVEAADAYWSFREGRGPDPHTASAERLRLGRPWVMLASGIFGELVSIGTLLAFVFGAFAKGAAMGGPRGLVFAAGVAVMLAGIASDNGCSWSVQSALVAVSGCRQALHLSDRPLWRTARAGAHPPRFGVFLGRGIRGGAQIARV